VTDATISRRARRELLDAAEWIARDNPVAAQGLQEAVIKAAELIGTRPAIGAVRTNLARGPYRFLALTGFPHIIVYNTDQNRPRIVRVVHGARDLRNALRDLP
jgi:toxin ParE1/3/4